MYVECECLSERARGLATVVRNPAVSVCRCVSRFQCRAEGYYADPEFNCEVFHYCSASGARFTFLCGEGSKFHQVGELPLWILLLITRPFNICAHSNSLLE